MRTRVGYAGGSTVNPTYHDLADHTEAFQLDFDPAIVTYAELLADALRGYRPSRHDYRQYMTAVFAETAEQAKLARGYQAPVIEGARFHLAEDYHQKYYLRHDSTLMRELSHLSPQAFVDSTLAARLNGIVGRKASKAQLREMLPTLALSADARAHLERLVVHERP